MIHSEHAPRLTDRFGPGISDWVSAVPELILRYAEDWRLSDLDDTGEQGASSIVLRCRRVDGTRAILKLAPDVNTLAEEIRALGLFARSHRVPRVLASAPQALLMDAILPGTATHPEPLAWAALVTDLHAVGGTTSRLRPDVQRLSTGRGH